MTKRVLKRILMLIPTVIGVSFIVFLLFYLSPGDAALAKAGPNAPKEVIEALREKMGLNDPFLAQYLRFLKVLYKLFVKSFLLLDFLKYFISFVFNNI